MCIKILSKNALDLNFLSKYLTHNKSWQNFYFTNIPSETVAMYTSLKITLYLLILTNIIYCLEIGSPCKDKQNNDGVCKEYSECSVIKDKLINRKMSLKDIISCQIPGVICCTLDSTPINTFRSQFNMRNVGDISQRSEFLFCFKLL